MPNRCATWTIAKAQKVGVEEAFEIWCYGKTRWTDRIIDNEKVLARGFGKKWASTQKKKQNERIGVCFFRIRRVEGKKSQRKMTITKWYVQTQLWKIDKIISVAKFEKEGCRCGNRSK